MPLVNGEDVGKGGGALGVLEKSENFCIRVFACNKCNLLFCYILMCFFLDLHTSREALRRSFVYYRSVS
jgi:hypothetical protein